MNCFRRLTFSTLEPVEAELVIKTPTQTRPPKLEELVELNLFPQVLLYERRKEIVSALFGDAARSENESDRMSILRSLLDYAGQYAHLPLTDETLDRFRDLWLTPEERGAA